MAMTELVRLQDEAARPDSELRRHCCMLMSCGLCACQIAFCVAQAFLEEPPRPQMGPRPP
ncbi:hypothetical protein [Mumia zhuanghuii]|uniref:Uncharacterized protein n=1 Tax=Mumia zhuanghuii TaxID=2585211 RepID=A0A5C4MAC2_9ACTN|nr:hypothetical protein [Mumia zhuanghuii]TNC28430.1 hypothetical protein FHE65_33965 [Mumia zhuanghuii]